MRAHRRLPTAWVPLALLSALAAPAAQAAWPPPPNATEAQLADPANWPDDPEYGDAFHLHGFDDRGMRLDAAFATTRGDPNVVIALLAAGTRWDDADLVSRYALNRGELPLPQDAAGNTGTGADPHDLNGDGRFDVRDYAEDARVTDANGNGLRDPQDLLAAFSDGVDDDGNGLVDDLCGWDFVEGDNDAEGATSTALGRLIAAEANNGLGTVGACPDCALLPLRIAVDSAPALPGRATRALRYATDAGARVTALPHPVVQRTVALEQALDHAQAQGTLVVAAATWRGRWHEDLPPHLAVLLVSRAGPGGELSGCGAAPPWLDLRAAAPGCAPEAAATAAGVAGLVASAGGGSLFQLLGAGAGAGAGLDNQRIDAADAVARAAAPTQPPRFATLSPRPRSRHLASQPVSVRATVDDAAVPVELHVARGRAPADSDFVALQGGAFVPNDIAATSLDNTFTLRALATKDGVTSLRRWLIVTQVVSDTSADAALPNVATSARLVDLDGDLDDELLLPGRDGKLHVLDAQLKPRPGFPYDLGDSATIVAPIAAAELVPFSERTLFAATLEGTLHAVRSDGVALFTAPIEGGMRAAPVIVESFLGPVVLAAALDGRLHAFHGLTGTPLQGFPFQLPLVEVRFTPAAGDLDGDGLPEVVIAGRDASGAGAAVVVNVLEDGAAIRSGWPVSLEAKGSPVIAKLGSGSDSVHLIFPIEGDLPRLFGLDGAPGLALATTLRTGTPPTELALGSLRSSRVTLAGPLSNQTALWGLSDGWRRDPQEPVSPDTFFGEWAPGSGAAVADVSGDGRPELITGVGEVLRAINEDGTTIPGHPVELGAPLRGTPTVGVQNNRLRLVAVTDDGYAYPLLAPGQPAQIQWDGAHHDPAHTGNFDTPLPFREVSGIGVLPPPDPEDGCGCQLANAPALGGLAFLILFIRTQRRRL